jgi:hypothetical protein
MLKYIEYKKWMCYIDGQKNTYSVLKECNRMLKYIEYKKWMCYIDGQKNTYSVLNECNRMLKYNILNFFLVQN